MILGLDPSSTRTGYCFMHADRRIEDAGIITGTSGAHYTRRSREIANEVAEMIASVPVASLSKIFVEIPSGHVGWARKSNGAGLSIYGFAVGAMYFAVSQAAPGRVSWVTETDWTKGRRKQTRSQKISMLYPEYLAQQHRDSGMDVADAIGLCLWWFENRADETGVTDDGTKADCEERGEVECR